jgi:histidyl-tRNA synthetase
VGIAPTVVQMLVTVFNPESRSASTRLTADLRRAGIRAELYMEEKGLGKQFNYADKKGIPLVAILGPEEAAQGVVKLKRLRDGQEVIVAAAEAGGKAQELLAD